MCGITGILSKNPISIKTLIGMNELIAHRGPDDEGFVLFDASSFTFFGGPQTPVKVYKSLIPYCPNLTITEELPSKSFTLALAHRRLAIVDLSDAGHQPMSYDNGRYWIVYNGEIYNFIELRIELEYLGAKFFSNSDTEVILAAYTFWGHDCLEKFKGMWAFAIYDRELQRLFLARDPFGIKPIYYWFAPDGSFCFGSEIKQFTAYPGWGAFLNKQRAVDYLAWGLTDHTDETLFDGVYQVRPGHYLVINQETLANNSGKLRAKQWFHFGNELIRENFQSCSALFRQKFIDSVRLHMRSDVPMGSCLSGGLDSSSIVGVANNELQKETPILIQKTFSACSVDESFDERKWVEEVVKGAKNMESHYLYPSVSNLFADLPRITWHQDEPFGSTSVFAQWSIFESAAKNDVKVMLDGQGADEQLAGYYEYFAIRFSTLFYKGNWISLLRELIKTKSLHHFSNAYVLSLLLSGIIPSKAKKWIKRILSGNDSSHLDWLNLGDGDVAFTYPFVEKIHAPKSIRQFSEQQLMRTNLQMLLHWEDRNSMAHSVESRVPFLDHELVNLSLNIPDQYKISDGITKRILRSAMKNILPSIICTRMDKMGFVTSEELWMTRHEPDLFRSKLKLAPDNSCGLINKNIQSDLEKMISGKLKFDFRVWRAISFIDWVRCFSIKVR